MARGRRGPSTRSRQLVRAPVEKVYAAFVDPDLLLKWLPPAEMTGKFHRFDARVGGGYRMSLFYPPDERTHRGKSADKEDMVDVRFVALDPPRRVVEAVTFVSDDPAFHGEMTITVTIDPVPEGTRVTMLFENLPPGLRPEDNMNGAALSLMQLARLLS